MVVCEVRPQKEDPNRTRYQGDIGTPIGSLNLVMLVINSVLYCCNARFVCFDLKNFYLQTPMDQPDYLRIILSDIPQEFIEEYNPTQLVQN